MLMYSPERNNVVYNDQFSSMVLTEVLFMLKYSFDKSDSSPRIFAFLYNGILHGSYFGW